MFSKSIQRELAMLLESRYQLIFDEDRPEGVSSTALPVISVWQDAGTYYACLKWKKSEMNLAFSSMDTIELLTVQSPLLIDRAIFLKNNRKPYIRRPLLSELNIGIQPDAIYVSLINGNRLKCEPIYHFGWHSENQFVCIKTQEIEQAYLNNNMVLDGSSEIISFPQREVLRKNS